MGWTALATVSAALSSGGCRDGLAASGRVDAGSGNVDAGTRKVDAATSAGRWRGRVDASDPGGPRFAWSGSGFAAIVRGARISVRLRAEGDAPVFFQPVVDGTLGARFEVRGGPSQVAVLGASLSAADHVVEVYRETESSFGSTVFEGFAEGTVVGAPPSSGRLIEVIGDSITAGYGDLGTEVHPPWDNTCTFSVDTESAYRSYAAVMARDLNAELSAIARSGWGVLRDGNGNPGNVIPRLYASALGVPSSPAWAFRRPADAVVINLGTNDVRRSDPGRPFEDAYVEFLRVVRAHNPAAWIFLTIGTMTSDPALSQMRAHLSNVVSTLGDAKVSTVDLRSQDTSRTGCDYHPDVAEQQAIGKAVGAAVKAKLGW